MWYQKYRPKNLSECVLEHIDGNGGQLLAQWARTSTLPNILFHGPPGTGKTTIANILCDEDRFAVSRFNGSLFGTPQINKILGFITSYGFTNSFDVGMRVIFVDEFDGASQNAQRALRALMEQEGKNASWLFTANHLQRIIPPLLSRVIMIDCSYATLERRMVHMLGIVRRCREILHSEEIDDVSDSEILAIVERHYPDVRRTITELETKCAARLAA